MWCHMKMWKIKFFMVILKFWQFLSTWKLKHLPFFFTINFNTHSYRVRCVTAAVLNFISIVPQDFSKRKRIPDVQIQNVVFYGHMRYLQRVQVILSQLKFCFIFVMGTWNSFLCLSQARTWISNVICHDPFLCSMIWGERWLFVLLILVELLTINV